jgi:hypothetical protein
LYRLRKDPIKERELMILERREKRAPETSVLG